MRRVLTESAIRVFRALARLARLRRRHGKAEARIVLRGLRIALHGPDLMGLWSMELRWPGGSLIEPLSRAGMVQYRMYEERN